MHLGRGAHGSRARIEDRRVPRDALAHARSSAHHDERRRLQPRQQLVEIVVAGGQACDRLTAVVQLLEPAEAALEQVVHRCDGVGDAPLRDVVDHRLGAVDRLGDVVREAVPELRDLARDADESTEQRVLLDDVRVAPGVGDRRRGRLQIDEHARPADRVEQVRAAELLGDRDRVDGLAGAVQRRDRLEDVPVRRLVEVVARDDLDRGRDRAGRQQHRAEQRGFGVEVVRRNPPNPSGSPRGVGGAVGHWLSPSRDGVVGR